MALKDIFTMIKADRYTADGCEEIKKAQEAIKDEIEDAGLPDGTQRQRKDGLYVKQGGKWVPAPAAKKGGAGKGTTAQRMKSYVDAMNKKNGEFAGSYKKSKAKSDAMKQEQLAELNRASSESKSALTQVDGKGNKVEIKITESKGGGFYIDKYVNGKKIGINNANTRESAETKAKSMMEQHMADPDYKAESKPAEKPKVKLGEGANNYVFKDLANMSDEDKVFRALVAELDESFGDRDGDPDGVESWAEGWKDNAVYEGGIGFKTSHSSEEPDAVVSGDDVKAIIEKNPKRWNRIIKNAKQFYSGNGHSSNFESDVYYPEDAAPRQLTGDCKIRIRRSK